MFYDGTHFMGGMHWLWWLFWLALIGDISAQEYEQRKALLDRDAGSKT